MSTTWFREDVSPVSPAAHVWRMIGINDIPGCPAEVYGQRRRGLLPLGGEENWVPPENVTLLTNEQASLVSLCSTWEPDQERGP
jgi:hypothetical protein